MATKRKQTSIPLDLKIRLIEEVDKKTRSKVDICKEFNIPKSTLSTILKNREKLEQAATTFSFQPDRKRLRTADHNQLDEALLCWFKQARAMQVPVSGPILLEKAAELAKTMGIVFNSSPSWIERFKARNGIHFRTICGESASAPVDGANKWISTDLQRILAEYEPKDIFNADETGLFYQCLPNKSLVEKGETCAGGKLSKNRLSVLITANMDGSEKLPLLVIGKFERPRCFKNVKTLPTTYKANRKAWMTSKIFEEWARTQDGKFHRQGRKVALIVDNCPAHPRLEGLKATELIFLPPNTTSLIQPCDQGIIKNFKQLYRKAVVKKLIVHVEQNKSVTTPSEFKIDVLQAMYTMRHAWDQVIPSTIANCFRHAGWKRKETLQENDEDATTEGDNDNDEDTEAKNGQDDSELSNLFDRLSNLIPLNVTMDAFVNIDESVRTNEEMTVSDIVASVQEQNGEDPADVDMDDNSPPDNPPTLKEARDAFTVFTKFMQTQPMEAQHFDAIQSLDEMLDDASLKATKQLRITDFFKR